MYIKQRSSAYEMLTTMKIAGLDFKVYTNNSFICFKNGSQSTELKFPLSIYKSLNNLSTTIIDTRNTLLKILNAPAQETDLHRATQIMSWLDQYLKVKI